jgi:hypothetical protein
VVVLVSSADDVRTTDVGDWLANRRETFLDMAEACGYEDAYDWLMQDAMRTDESWPPAFTDEK